MTIPRYKLIGGPLDGATQFAGTVAGFGDGTVAARIHGLRSGYWLLYRGEVSFCGRPTQLRFVDWMPVDLHPPPVFPVCNGLCKKCASYARCQKLNEHTDAAGHDGQPEDPQKRIDE